MVERVEGIDVSSNQGPISNQKWKSFKESGIEFAFIKATEGTSYTDPQFQNNWQATQDVKIMRGAYHFWYPQWDATEQAQHFLKTINSVDISNDSDLPPVLDVESIKDDLRNAGMQACTDRIQTWLNVVSAEMKCQPIIYTGGWCWNELVSPVFGNYPLWVASYNPNQPAIPNGWSTWHFWQYAGGKKEKNQSPTPDRNRFNGTLDDLKKFQQDNHGQSSGTTPAAPSNSESYVMYTVKSGDTLLKIASQYHVPEQTIIDDNGIKNANLIEIDQQLKIRKAS